MKSFSKLNKSIISESVVELELLLNNKQQIHTSTASEILEKVIEEIIEALVERTSIGSDNAAKGRGYGGSRSGRSGYGGGTSRFRSSGLASYGAGNTSYGRITNRSAGSRLESQNIHPEAMTLFRAFWDELIEKGYEPFVTSGQRMPSHQRDLYDSGRGSQTAQPCRSDHQYGYALDINVNLPPRDGETESSGSARMNSSDDTWAPIVAIARDKGLTWQGSNDRVHFYVNGEVTSAMKDACKDFYGDINIRSRGVAAAMKAKEEESPSEINNILKIT